MSLLLTVTVSPLIAAAASDTAIVPPPATGNTEMVPPVADNGATFTLSNPLKVNSIGALVQSFVEVFSYVVILLAVLLLIYVGLQYVLARGNPQKIKELHSWLLWIVVGVAVVIGARVIVTVVINTLSLTGTVNQGVFNSANNALQGK